MLLRIVEWIFVLNVMGACLSMCRLITLLFLCSMSIESVVDGSAGKSDGGLHDAYCSTCEMAVVWVQNQLRQNQTQERILNYVNEVSVH